ncbi:hypothetical protein RFI_20026 [Reticulomyxa filosa]|uniref:RGS domain-containing protein n=1 Tax=Reticulomyxa filosa TaxID=46433 RepID=X6MUF6_RETFI|nr:hypothetical protein RFI_20026 [Reticulomyxa filosa]|eukprot:ETO17301.1 hypothetical protein RFI_20026 [Reticulomyxa filosa]
MCVKGELKMTVANIMVWETLMAIGLSAFYSTKFEKQLCVLLCESCLLCINTCIMLRPKDLYYRVKRHNLDCSLRELRGVAATAALVSMWKMCRIRNRYEVEYQIMKKHPSLSVRSVSQLSSLGSTEHEKEQENQLAIERSKQLTLEQVLTNENGFELFASHLVKELALENILYLVEYMQLKHFIFIRQSQLLTTSAGNKNRATGGASQPIGNHDALGLRIDICPTIVVHSLHPHLLRIDIPLTTSWQICLDMFHYLYSHYIMDGSVARLNLSFDSCTCIQQAMARLHFHSSVDVLPPLLEAFDTAAFSVLRLFWRIKKKGNIGLKKVRITLFALILGVVVFVNFSFLIFLFFMYCYRSSMPPFALSLGNEKIVLVKLFLTTSLFLFCQKLKGGKYHHNRSTEKDNM